MGDSNWRRSSSVLMRTLLTLVLSACASSAGKPGWVENPHSGYPQVDYLVGVGVGPEYNAAEGDAIGSLSAILFSDVKQTCKIMQMQKDDGQGDVVNRESVVCKTDVGTTTELEGVEVVERGRAGSEYYALAVLDRAKAKVSLTDRIRNIEASIGNQSKRAKGANTPLEGARILEPVLQQTRERDLLTAQYRVIAGNPWSSSLSTPALEKQYADVMDSVLFIIEANTLSEESGEEKVNRGLEKAIADEIDERGFSVSRDSSGNVQVVASVTLSEPFTRGPHGHTHYEWVAVLEVGSNARGARAFIVYEKSGGAAHASASMAKKVAIKQAGEVLIWNFRKELDAYLAFAE